MKKSGFVQCCLLVGGLLGAPRVEAAVDPIRDPQWKNQVIGVIKYRPIDPPQKPSSTPGFLKPLEELISGTGYTQKKLEYLPILGSELLAVFPLPRHEELVKVLRERGGEDGRPLLDSEIEQVIAAKLGETAHRGFAILSLQKILERRALDLGIPRQVPDQIVRFAYRQILAQNAADLDLIPTTLQETGNACESKKEKIPTDDPLHIAEWQLYSYLKKTLHDESAEIVIDWDFGPGKFNSIRNQLRSSGLSWSALKLQIHCQIGFGKKQKRSGCLPETEPRHVVDAIVRSAYDFGVIEWKARKRLADGLNKKIGEVMDTQRRAALWRKLPQSSDLDRIREVLQALVSGIPQGSGSAWAPGLLDQIEEAAWLAVRDEDLNRFKHWVQEKVQKYYQSIRLKAAWESLVAQMDPNVGAKISFSMQLGAAKKLYLENKEKHFKNLPKSVQGEFLRVEISGPEAAALDQWMAEEFGKKETFDETPDQFVQRVLQGFEKKQGPGRATVRTVQVSHPLTRQSACGLRADYSTPRLSEAEERWVSGEGDSAERQMEAQAVRRLLTKIEIKRMAAWMKEGGPQHSVVVGVGPTRDGTYFVSFLNQTRVTDRDHQPYLEFENPIVQDRLRTVFMAETQQRIFREVALKLWIRFPFVVEKDLSSGSAWPTVSYRYQRDAGIWNQLLFPDGFQMVFGEEVR